MKQLIKRLLREAVGVPVDIEKAAENLYNDFIEKIKSHKNFEVDDNGDDFKFSFKNTNGRYSFSDFNPKKINIVLNVRFYTSDEHKDPLIYGMGHIGTSKYNNQLQIISLPTNEVNLEISYAQPSDDVDVTNDKIVSTLEKSKKEHVSSLAHELKHAYDTKKKPKEKLQQRAKYNILSQTRGNVVALNKFLYNMYFIHNIENLVRPVEVYSDMVQSGVGTKEKFLEFFKNQKVLVTLRDISNYSIDNLIDELSQNESQLDQFLEGHDYDVDRLDLEEKVSLTLTVFYHILKQNLISQYQDAAVRVMRDNIDPLQFVFRMMVGDISISDEHKKIIEKLIKEIEKFDNNPLDFYDYEMNKGQNIAKTMIKKLSKLFSLVKTEKTVKTEIFDPMNFEMDQLRQKINKK